MSNISNILYESGTNALNLLCKKFQTWYSFKISIDEFGIPWRQEFLHKQMPSVLFVLNCMCIAIYCLELSSEFLDKDYYEVLEISSDATQAGSSESSSIM